jgi:hypothetical protein
VGPDPINDSPISDSCQHGYFFATTSYRANGLVVQTRSRPALVRDIALQKIDELGYTVTASR